MPAVGQARASELGSGLLGREWTASPSFYNLPEAQFVSAIKRSPEYTQRQERETISRLTGMFRQEQQKAIQPAVESYQAQIPVTEQKYAQRGEYLKGERAPLEERYQNLLSEITRREEVEVGGAQQTLSREYGRRGIPLSSGVFETGLQEKLSPIRQYYTGQTREVGLAGEEALRGLTQEISMLPIEEQEALGGINQAIAQLQAGGGQAAVQNALAMYQTQQQQAEMARQRTWEQAEAQRQREQQWKIANLPSTTGGGGVTDLPSLLGLTPAMTTAGGGVAEGLAQIFGEIPTKKELDVYAGKTGAAFKKAISSASGSLARLFGGGQ